MGANPRGHGLSLEGAQLCSIEDVQIRGDEDVGITGPPGSGGSTTNSTYKRGRAVPFGDLKPPGFPYPATPQL